MTARNDWRNPAAYQYALSQPLSCWAWEFLRRNPDYHALASTVGQSEQPTGSDRAGDWGLHSPGEPEQERR